MSRSLFGSTPSSGGLFGGNTGTTFGTQNTSGFSKYIMLFFKMGMVLPESRVIVYASQSECLGTYCFRSLHLFVSKPCCKLLTLSITSVCRGCNVHICCAYSLGRALSVAVSAEHLETGLCTVLYHMLPLLLLTLLEVICPAMLHSYRSISMVKSLLKHKSITCGNDAKIVNS